MTKVANETVPNHKLHLPGKLFKPSAKAITPTAGEELVSSVAQPRLQRRPIVALLSAALVLLGAVLSVWAYSSLGNAQEVVAVRVDVVKSRVVV